MANALPHIEDSNKTTYLPPVGTNETFADEEDYAEKVREWGLSTTKEVKKQFWYKEATFQRQVTIIGYQTYGKTDDYYTVIIEFEDGNLSCIHPAYLKEMQSPSFTKLVTSESENSPTETVPTKTVEEKAAPAEPKTKEAKPKKEKKEKPKKIELPEDKVHFTAVVKQFAYSWNHFNEENDEVVVLENVRIEQEDPIDIGLAWCSHSKTLKKFELSPGVSLEFDGKIVKKKLPSGKDVEEEFIISDPVPYKINNPSKIVKS
ncbi:hypothetical protein WMO40_01240 [Bacillaceae bacterium CLA-AA-H227]|uniref:Uncharacterized protein n=1 Tax=Robertmurraya yapensis (ex Hitch et al 2024) TaxID=3133160 RepID=A0ACC6S693_9BACI